MKGIRSATIAALLGVAVATASRAQDAMMDTLSKLDKASRILYIERMYGITFVRETASLNGMQMRWVFRAPDFGNVPTYVDVIAFPSAEQMTAAAAEAQYVYLWLLPKAKKKAHQ
jgi:hypothetical protein